MGNDSDLSDEEIIDFALLFDCEIVNLDEALRDLNWRETIHDEIHAIEKNEIWELTNFLATKRPMEVKWVYKTKYNFNGKNNHFKATLVAKGYKQNLDIEYLFAYVARLDIILMIISLLTWNYWKIYKMNVKSAYFSNGILHMLNNL